MLRKIKVPKQIDLNNSKIARSRHNILSENAQNSLYFIKIIIFRKAIFSVLKLLNKVV